MCPIASPKNARMRGMKKLILVVFGCPTMALSVAAQAPKTQPSRHRLEATPSTVSYGHSWPDLKPALTINSGVIIDFDTMLSNTTDRLEKSGVPASEIQASLRAIFEQVKDRGP